VIYAHEYLNRGLSTTYRSLVSYKIVPISFNALPPPFITYKLLLDIIEEHLTTTFALRAVHLLAYLFILTA